MANRVISAVLHADASHGAHSWLSAALVERLGRVGEFIDEVLIHGIIDTAKLVLFLFLTYLLMEFIEHKGAEKASRFMAKSGALGPLVGGALGAIPQCGFSAAAANLYTARVISLGTLIAVFLSTSDEMLPMMIAGEVKITTALLIIVYKSAVGALIGVLIDLVLRLMKKPTDEINIDEICANDNCHCERGILHSALHHTLSVSLFVLLVTFAVNAVLFFTGDSAAQAVLIDVPVLSHAISALIGLIPNCAVSVALTKLATAGVISVGTMMSGLFSGAGVGLLILFKMNRRIKENLIIAAMLVAVGTVFGIVADLIPFLSL